MIYPWHQATWDLLWTARRAGRLPHALLLSGSHGCGHEALIEELAHSLLCSHPTDAGFACGKCRSCEVYRANAHPDQLWVQPAEDKDSIGIDAVRELGRFLTLSISYSPTRVGVILPAESLNTNAANSLLKALEEPTPATHLVLYAYQAGLLLPTIRSRCQHFRLPLPSTEQALAWLTAQHTQQNAELLLSQAMGKPLYAWELDTSNQTTLRRECLHQLARVLQGQGSLTAFSAQWQKHPRAELLEWLYGALYEQLRSRYQVGCNLVSADPELQQWLNQCSSLRLWQWVQQWGELKSLVAHPLNNQIFIETIVTRWLTD